MSSLEENAVKRFKNIVLLPLLAVLSGCNAVVLNPSGDVAIQERDLLLIATALMLLVIIPVIVLTVLFAWRYRASNKDARYEPDWSHSVHLELVIWALPLLIIVWLGALTWMGSHLLDPYRSIGRVSSEHPIDANGKTLEIEVVALDWKWLFIYPEYQLATVNESAAPVDRPIRFRITSSSVMNSFYIPALAGQIYAMAGMETKLHAVINKPGDYRGFSANYSGDGFSGMRFVFHGMAQADFDAWVKKAKTHRETLSRSRYLELARPSQNEPAQQFGAVDPDLYHAILNMCVEPATPCMDAMQGMDMPGMAMPASEMPTDSTSTQNHTHHAH